MSVADGVVVVDKPSGWTSHDVVGRVRRIAGTRRVGHAGTLDPMATGVLVLGIGRGTRLLHYLVGADKEYHATIRLGVTTSTEDAEGDILSVSPADHVEGLEIAAAARQLTGEIQQVPSSVSAIKVDGKRAYARVRAGEQVDLPARPVTISRFTVGEPHTVTLPTGELVTDIRADIECSSGTYVRALARDLGLGLSVGGHLTALRRTRVASYTLDQAQTLEDLEQNFVPMTLATAAREIFPVRELTPDEVTALGYGKRIPASTITEPGTEERPAAGISSDGELIALLRDQDDHCRPVVVFAPAS